ncbi:MAG: nuclear transport factor 2 family protein [Vicinamibacteria bacterium]
MSVVTRIRTSEELAVPFTPEEVWSVLADVVAYPGWWPSKLEVKVLIEQAGLLGSEFEVRPWMGRMFRCRFEELDEPYGMRIRFFGGSLEGPGGFLLSPTGDGTQIRYEIDVFARGLDVALLNRILPLEKMHSLQMRSLLRSLAKRLRDVRKEAQNALAETARIASEAAAYVAAQEAERLATEASAARLATEALAKKRADREAAEKVAAEKAAAAKAAAKKRAAEEKAHALAADRAARQVAEQEAARAILAAEQARLAAEVEARRAAEAREAERRADESRARQLADDAQVASAARLAEERLALARAAASKALIRPTQITPAQPVPAQVALTPLEGAPSVTIDASSAPSPRGRLFKAVENWLFEAPGTPVSSVSPPRPPAEPKSNFDIARDYLRALSSTAPPDEIGRFFAADAVEEAYPNRFVQIMEGRNFPGRFVHQSYELRGATGGGTQVAMEVLWKGTVGTTGDGFVAGQELEAHLAFMLKFADGKIARLRTYACFEPWSNAVEREACLRRRTEETEAHDAVRQDGPPVPSRAPVSSASNFDNARSLLEALSGRADAETIGAFYAEDVIQQEFPHPLLPDGAARDRDGLIEVRQRGLAMFTSERYELRGATGGGSQVAMEVHWTAVVRKAGGGFREGQTVEARLAFFLKYQDGLIVRQRIYDCLGL